MGFVWAALALAGLYLVSGIRICREYERLVIFRLGRLVGSPGRGCSGSRRFSRTA